MQKRWMIFAAVLAVFSAGTETSIAQVGIFDLQADWGSEDFPPRSGNFKALGSAVMDGDTYLIQGNGDDIWDANDEGFFLYTELPGSRQITGRVIWDDPDSEEWAKIGLMMREDGADPKSRHYWIELRGAGFGDRADAQWRGVYNGESDYTQIFDDEGHGVAADSDAAIWFRLTRIAEADLVMSEWSLDGAEWHLGDVRTMGFDETIAWGLAITNHADNQTTAKGRVEGVSISTPELAVGIRSIEGPAYYRADSEYTVTIDLINTSDSGVTVDVSETVPLGWVISGISGGGHESGGTIAWPGYSVSPDGGRLSYNLKVPFGTDVPAVFNGTVGSLLINGPNTLSALGTPVGIFDGHADMGQVDLPGDVFYDEEANEYYVDGSGDDIWGKADEFHFLFKEIDSYARLKAYIALETYESPIEWIKAALMVRDDLTADSAHGLVLLRPDGQHDFEWRLENGGDSGNSGLNGNNYGEVEIERYGNTVNLYYYSADTGERILGESLELAMEDPVYIGLAVTSGEDGRLATGIFSDVEYTEFDGYAVRSLPSETLPVGGGAIEGIQITVTIAEGRISSASVMEEIPAGFTAENIQASHGAVETADGFIVWNLDGLAGTATMTYGLELSTADAKSPVYFHGEFDGLEIFGGSTMLPVFFRVPFIDRTVVLDGVLEDGEYGGAYQETFDHSDRIPPGVHWAPAGGEVDRDTESAAFYLYHNDEYIFCAIDVLDTLGLDFDSGTEVWQHDSTELYLDGNLSRSNPKENLAAGFQATVLGNGLSAGGNDPPAMTALANGGGASSNGAYWNAGAKAKDTGDGYIVEYAVTKSQVLSPADRSVIGFDILMNSADGSAMRTGRWGYWNTRLDAAETDREYWNDERGWAIIELASGTTGLEDWALY